MFGIASPRISVTGRFWVIEIRSPVTSSFSHDLLAAVSPLGRAALNVALNRLVGAGLIYRRGGLSPAVWIVGVIVIVALALVIFAT